MSCSFMVRILSGSRCSFSVVVWCLVGCVVTLHLYSLVHHKEEVGDVHVRLNHVSLTHELEKIEEEDFYIPPKGKGFSRAMKLKAKPIKTTSIEEFLDKNSQVRHLFFPDRKTAIDPTKEVEYDKLHFRPGKMWLDTNGDPIQAHGGGIIYIETSKTYYWYGENKDGPTYHAHKGASARVDIVGVSCYSSKDLWTWKNEGIVLAGEQTNTTHDLYKLNVLERPKVIYNDKTEKYVMWMHIDSANYVKASTGVAIADHPTGPFAYLYSKNPHGFDSRDVTVFKDDDGKAYVIYSSKVNSELHIGPLTDDYLDVTSVMIKILVGKRREAPALFKYKGIYYMITSGCSSWEPNEALGHAAESILGPWETMGNPCKGGNMVFRQTTFFSQSTFVLPLPGIPGSFLFMADRWNPSELKDSRYVWLPLTVGGAADEALNDIFSFPLWSRVSIYWHRSWKFPDGWIGQK